ncbi:hypothetical protein HanXRQr2_Chr07g0305521 [Helianthus annuus]|uniref:Uncharacterized protein n=2 Tax=Helianthus annuus TaxID=4232 RepID=A0A9K3IMY3_HELAN|nr:hypothetical protein HanXRQr2_Chr07g0305521 [Helianthus annuus]
MNLPTTASLSQSDAGVKDSKSYTVDDATPLSGNNESRKSTGDLKRTLEGSYDVDNSYSFSPSKSRKTETKDETKAQSKDKLLIPKLEK